jgi:uncharacterized protein YdbL (DUF1318 family)
MVFQIIITENQNQEELKMNKEKKVWLCEQYAQKAWALSLNLAQEAARVGNYGKGYAVVASEARKLADNLLDYSAKARFEKYNEDEFKDIASFAFMTGLLSINATIEILHVSEVDDKINNKSIAVCVEDLRRLALELNELGGKKLWQRPFVIPEITSPVKTTRKTDFFFKFSIGEITLVENALNVKEIWFGNKSDTSGNMFNLRGHEMHIIDCAKQFNLKYSCLDTDRQTVMIINPNYHKYYGYREQEYALLIDDLDVNTIFHSKIGYPVTVKEEHVFSEYSRECWDAVGNAQFVFLDWLKLISK